MAKPAITLRSATAPTPLTYAQLDQNFTNLKDATISLDAGTGGTTVTADLNGKITLVAGTGITLSGDNTAKTLTITNSSLGANSFGKIVVSGQSDVDADTTADTLTLVAGVGINITTDAGTDSVTIEASGAAGTGTINAGVAGRLTYYPTSGTTVDDVPNINYDGTNNIFNVLSTLKMLPTSGKPTVDVSRLTLGVDGLLATAGDTLDFANFAGLVVIASFDSTYPGIAVYKCIGNAVTEIQPTQSNMGTVTYQSSINGYRWTNDTGRTFYINHFTVMMKPNS